MAISVAACTASSGAPVDGSVQIAADGGLPIRRTDAGVDAGVPQIGGCPTGQALAPGSSGPVNLAEVQDHGLEGCYRCTLAAADFDGDGRIDLAMAGPFDSLYRSDHSYANNNLLRIYENTSCPGEEIRFRLANELPNTVGAGGAIVVAGDFNGDGKIDVAVQFREGEAPASDTAAFFNEGGFQFSKHALGEFDTQSNSLGMAKGDFDGDRLDDLVFNSDSYGMARGLWYRWNGSDFEARQSDYSHHISYGGTIAAGDLDGDGLADIAVGGNSDQPFGTYDCSSTKLYGEIHFNAGPGSGPGAAQIQLDGLSLSRFAMRADRANLTPCMGVDNASMQFADMDNDGTLDIVFAGSSDAFPGPPPGPPESNGSQYDFVVLFNRDGTGRNFVGWENAGIQYPNGTTNGGTGNLDTPSTAVGDLNGDGWPDVFMQGHHRDFAGDPGRYVFDTRLFLSIEGTEFVEVEMGLPDVGEGGQAMADFNNDGKIDLIFSGAAIPFHTNGNNPTDMNDKSTIRAYVYRNTRP